MDELISTAVPRISLLLPKKTNLDAGSTKNNINKYSHGKVTFSTLPTILNLCRLSSKPRISVVEIVERNIAIKPHYLQMYFDWELYLRLKAAGVRDELIARAMGVSFAFFERTLDPTGKDGHDHAADREEAWYGRFLDQK